MSAQEAASERCSSLMEEAFREAERHKWIESQKCGRDLGEQAIHEWFVKHWDGYCRNRRLEHVLGRRNCAEFKSEHYGDMASLLKRGDLLADRIVDRVRVGQENLQIIWWALHWGLPTERVVEILARVDVNCARIRSPLR